jgi:hypothetical protein
MSVNPTYYWLLGAAVSLGIGGLFVWARRRGGKRLLGIAWAVSAAVLLTVGYNDWRSQSPRETPLITYVLVALLPTAAAAGLVLFLATRDTRPAVQVAIVALISFFLVVASLVTVFFP